MSSSLPDVSFTNNLGTITFKRCLIGVTDSWEWAGRGVKRVKSISISGHVKQSGLGEKLDGIISDPTVPGRESGQTGTLTLPWTVIQNVKVTGLQWPEGRWIDFQPIECVFVDDTPANNRYTFTLLGHTLYNPRLSVPIPTRQIVDSYTQMRWMPGGGFVVNDPRAGVFRMRRGETNMELSVSGALRLEGAKLPDNLIQTLQMRCGLNNPLPNYASLPGGYPQPFHLGDAIPEVRADMNLAHCIVAGGTVSWMVEDQVAQIGLRILCPPQRPDRSG